MPFVDAFSLVADDPFETSHLFCKQRPAAAAILPNTQKRLRIKSNIPSLITDDCNPSTGLSCKKEKKTEYVVYSADTCTDIWSKFWVSLSLLSLVLNSPWILTDFTQEARAACYQFLRKGRKCLNFQCLHCVLHQAHFQCVHSVL